MDSVFKEAINEKNELILNMKSIILSTICDRNTPNSSYAPSIRGGNGDFYVYVSELSKHTRNILQNSRISAMIIEDESKADNLFARKRLTMDCNAQKIERGVDEWEETLNEMRSKLGDTIKFLKDMTDFHLFKLVPINGLLVYGFGKAFKFKDGNLDSFSHLNDKGHTKS